MIFVHFFITFALTFFSLCDIIHNVDSKEVNDRKVMLPKSHLGVAQLVARYLGVVEAASSSLVTQTKEKPL